MNLAEAHERTTELLPWFVNGSLSDDETALVERHVRDCLPCRNALKEQQRLAKLIRERPLVSVSPDRAFDRLMQRIDGDRPATRSRRRAGASAAATGKLAIAASVVVAVLLGAGLWMLDRELTADGEFSTLTDPGAADGARVDIVFVDGLAEAEIRALLTEIDASIVAGPTELGRYTVRVPVGAEVESVVRRLLDDARVRFAGRSFDADGPE